MVHNFYGKVQCVISSLKSLIRAHGQVGALPLIRIALIGIDVYKRQRLMYWQTEPNPHLVRADLANLRRGIGKKPGELPQLWELLFRDFPEELMSQNGNPTWEEWAVCGALTLYAMHQQGNDQKMHMDGQRLGIAIGSLADGDEDHLKPVQRRFNAFATAKGMPECCLLYTSRCV